MNITRENYEIWFLDYLEERLNEGDLEAVRHFMQQHPDLAEELDNLVPVVSADTGLLFPGKEQLKKVSFDDPVFFETSAIAVLEGDLNDEEKSSFEEYMSRHPDHNHLLRQFENTRLKPDFSIGFTGKERLKKRSNLRVLWIRLSAVAAIFLLVFYLIYPQKQVNEQVVSSAVEKEVPAKVNQSETKIAAVLPPAPVASRVMPSIKVKNTATKTPKNQKPLIAADVKRTFVPMEAMQSKTVAVHTYEQEFADLMPVREFGMQYFASSEIQLSEYLNDKFREIKAEGNAVYLSREGLTLAGLRLFSWLPGRRLTGEKGNDGRLRSISFSTQLLAFSIPLNREL